VTVPCHLEFRTLCRDCRPSEVVHQLGVPVRGVWARGLRCWIGRLPCRGVSTRGCWSRINDGDESRGEKCISPLQWRNLILLVRGGRLIRTERLWEGTEGEIRLSGIDPVEDINGTS